MKQNRRAGRSTLHPISLWRAFTRIRRTRPFWGCLVLALGGWFVLSPVLSGFSATLDLGVGGVSGYILGGGMIAAAAVAMVAPAQRHFPAIMAIMMAVASLPLANLGGWLIGMVLGIIGGGMVFAWTPYSEAQLTKRAERHAARQARRNVEAVTS